MYQVRTDFSWVFFRLLPATYTTYFVNGGGKLDTKKHTNAGTKLMKTGTVCADNSPPKHLYKKNRPQESGTTGM